MQETTGSLSLEHCSGEDKLAGCIIVDNLKDPNGMSKTPNQEWVKFQIDQGLNKHLEC